MTYLVGSIPVFSACLFHVVPRIPGDVADEQKRLGLLGWSIKDKLSSLARDEAQLIQVITFDSIFLVL